ncbi:hypothetical protein GGE12_005411 [Rhizobium mongolense]|uniref:Uncharacterized protein n=1 Tax=Rhizobium mongolense TaxID=57676 RepID=A0A7W6RS46_9HYPH|nr:hypothetical protein [Rhizobium mongolense]
MRQQTKPFIVVHKPSRKPNPTPQNRRSGEGWMLTLHTVSGTSVIQITRPPPVVTTALEH